MAGVIAGTITMTGLANMLINGIVALACNQVVIALFLTMVCCIVLGRMISLGQIASYIGITI